ncbi:hypothetical protein RHMOL_Rhmol11G0083000 [Rhododendron molle]|uniref:Uncharacterized protein n=1 Tax=Rhododendron molle TaxID=49168 RepID=A0ACC0LQV8_RHOML|nr:hypothetical protein RHMOL_Rhmol11G0083000 [Rhododendron molle]
MRNSDSSRAVFHRMIKHWPPRKLLPAWPSSRMHKALQRAHGMTVKKSWMNEGYGAHVHCTICLLNVKVQTREMVSRYWMLQTYDRSLETKSMFSTLAKKYDGYVIFGDNDKGNVISIGFKVLGIFIGDQIKRLSLAALKVFGRGLWLVFLIGHFKFGLCHFTVTSDKNDNLAHAQNSIEAFAKQGASLFRLPEIFHSRSQTPSQQKINLPLSTQLNAKIAEQNELREKELPLVLDNEKALTTKKDATRLAFFKDAQSTAMCSWDDCQKTMNE